MGTEIIIKKSPSDPTILIDPTTRIRSPLISCNERGFERLEGEIGLPLTQAAATFPAPGTPHVTAGWNGQRLFEGRLEDSTLRAAAESGARMTAFGYQRALYDLPYTAFWSDTTVKRWRPVTSSEVAAGRTPDKYNIDFNGRIYLSLKKGQTYATGGAADVGGVIIQIPYGSGKKIVGFELDFVANLPNPAGAGSWEFYYVTWNEGFTGAAGTLISTMSGALLTRTVHYVVTACDYLELAIFNNWGGGADTPAGEDGANYIVIGNLRVVTSTANRVNTTLGTTFGAGGSQTVTPASMANIYVGQSLRINQGTATSESVTVTAVTSTTFTAIFGGPHNAADTVNAHVVYADEIVKDMLSTVRATNADQLNAATIRIQNPSLDLYEEVYEDARMADILDYLIGLGDNQTTPRLWEWGVWENRVLCFRPRGSAGRAWFINVTSLEIARTLEQLANATYALYADAHGRTLRTSTNADASSVRRYALTRRAAYDTNTTRSQQAEKLRDVSLNDTKDPVPRASLTLDRLTSADGSIWPIWMLRPGDTLTVRNVPPSIALKVRTFRVHRTEYDPVTREVSIELETPLPGLDTLLARVAASIPRSL